MIVPVGPKLLYEYGLVGTLAVAAFLATVVVRDGRRVGWFAGLVLVYAVLNASLLQVTLAGVTYLFLSTLAPRGTPEVIRSPGARSAGVPAGRRGPGRTRSAPAAAPPPGRTRTRLRRPR